MPNKPVEALIICPFYRSINDNTIRCEAPPPAHDFLMRFENRDRMNRYLRLQCADFVAHRACPFAGLLYDRYEATKEPTLPDPFEAVSEP